LHSHFLNLTAVVADFILCIDYLSATELPALVRSPTNDGSGGMNFQKVTVLSKADWEGIQYRLNKRQIEAEKIRKAQEEKQRLHELSVERAKNWSNTIYVREAWLYSYTLNVAMHCLLLCPTNNILHFFCLMKMHLT